MHLSHLNALRALDATLRHGSFSLAANELGITPAAVGQRVRSLELYLGKSLFIRSSAGIEPTEGALRVQDLLEDGFARLAQAFEQLKPNDAAGRLRITLPESFSENWLSPMLVEFHLQYPDADFYFDPSNRDIDLVREDYDLAIRYGPTRDTVLEERVLFGDFVAPVCSPAFADQHGLGPDARSLKGVPLIHVTNRTKDPGWLDFQAWGDAFGFDRDHLNHGVRISKTGSGLQAAAVGQGLALCGVVEAFHALKAGALILPFGPSMMCRTKYAYRLLWARSRANSDLRALFVEWIADKSDRFVGELDAYLASQGSRASG
ncbi:LysR substrate-binding domain-containing protein [Marimonas lutisalis]|uniref:LysR substrate-binding domain-containing protein n=1 Tax=Marimonas lutisalis TaxID=2545756 RepID=UPI0010F79B66|nr:LysR substrate-binding domain-containing protein [Marimonas lutisalis]